MTGIYSSYSAYFDLVRAIRCYCTFCFHFDIHQTGFFRSLFLLYAVSFLSRHGLLFPSAIRSFIQAIIVESDCLQHGVNFVTSYSIHFWSLLLCAQQQTILVVATLLRKVFKNFESQKKRSKMADGHNWLLLTFTEQGFD